MSKIRTELARTRTKLAWTRTVIAILGLGITYMGYRYTAGMSSIPDPRAIFREK